MDVLHSLLHSLSPAERRAFLHQLRINKKEENKSLKLATAMLAKKSAPPNRELAHIVYGKILGGKKVEMLKKRLRNRLEDFLISDANLERCKDIPEVDRVITKIKKKLALKSYFEKHRNIELTKAILDEAIALSKEYEYYFGVVEGLNQKRNLLVLTNGPKEIELIDKEIEFYEYCHQSFWRACNLYYELCSLYDFYGNYDYAFIKRFHKASIRELKKRFDKTGSQLINYYSKFIELDHYLIQQKYEQAKAVIFQQMDIINGNKAIFRKSRITLACWNIINCYVHLNDFQSALYYCSLAKSFSIKHTVNYYVTIQQEFYVHFYNKDYNNAFQASVEVLQSSPSEMGKFRYSTYQFGHTCVLFMKKNYKDVLKFLNENLEVSKDKAGWEVSLRALMIMCNIELNRTDEAANHIENLRKHIEYHKRDPLLFERQKIIARLLLLLQSKGFRFRDLGEKGAKLITELKSNDPQKRWEYFTHELIPFHKWFEKKMRGERTEVRITK